MTYIAPQAAALFHATTAVVSDRQSVLIVGRTMSETVPFYCKLLDNVQDVFAFYKQSDCEERRSKHERLYKNGARIICRGENSEHGITQFGVIICDPRVSNAVFERDIRPCATPTATVMLVYL